MQLGFVGLGRMGAGMAERLRGGVWGPQYGYALMVGGDRAYVERLMPIFEALKPSLTGEADEPASGDS